MKKKHNILVWVLGLLLFANLQLVAQQDEAKLEEKALTESRDLTYQANNELVENDFVSAEANYRRAISKSDSNAVAPYNLGNSYYNRESFGEAFGRYKEAGERVKNKTGKHKAFHNMGNVFMKNKEYGKAVEAYKEALRNNPKDEQTRYNLALAKEMMKKEQQQNQNQNKDDQNKDDQKEENEQDQDKQSQGGDEDDQQEQEQEEQPKGGEDEEEQNKQEEGEDDKDQQPQQEQQQKPRPNQLSKQQIENLLEAMQNEEKKVQEKMEAKKVKGPRVKNEKDW